VPIPPLRIDGTLPPGFYDATLDEIFAAFPPITARRRILNETLTDFVATVKQLGFVQEIAIDGSFITAKREPDDVDLVVLTPGIYQLDGEPFLIAEGVDLLKMDVLFAHDHFDYQQWLGFFSTKRDLTPKGLIHLVYW
jgi:hypothetical protein